jgi:hypothetical protein
MQEVVGSSPISPTIFALEVLGLGGFFVVETHLEHFQQYINEK